MGYHDVVQQDYVFFHLGRRRAFDAPRKLNRRYEIP